MRNKVIILVFILVLAISGCNDSKHTHEEKKNNNLNFKPKKQTLAYGLVDMGKYIEPSMVKITDNLYVSKYEVTFSEYDKYCEDTKYEKTDDKGWGRGDRPVIDLLSYEIINYITWLNKQSNKKYRLLTEKEWEYIATEQKSRKYAWYWGNSGGKTQSVGEKEPNKFGLYDVYGNVWELTSSIYTKEKTEDNYYENNHLTLKGGSWLDDEKEITLKSRKSDSGMKSWGNEKGFRLAYTQEVTQRYTENE